MDRNFGIQTDRPLRHASLSARRAWIEILYQLYDTYAKVSLSARRAWIEIGEGRDTRGGGTVALRKESVDRNKIHREFNPDRFKVALRKESVDRNDNGGG